MLAHARRTFPHCALAINLNPVNVALVRAVELIKMRSRRRYSSRRLHRTLFSRFYVDPTTSRKGFSRDFISNRSLHGFPQLPEESIPTRVSSYVNDAKVEESRVEEDFRSEITRACEYRRGTGSTVRHYGAK